MTKPKYPQKRMIVFAGLASQETRLIAMYNKRIEALMGSFMLVKKGKWFVKRAVPMLDKWENYRYLDSGAFTFLRRSSVARLSTRSMPIAHQSTKRVDIIEYKTYKDHLTEYVAFLREHLDKWDFVFELDVDTLQVQSNGKIVPGIEVTYASRKVLREIAKDKLIPVWHIMTNPDPNYTRWKEMCAEYGYVAMGSGPAPESRLARYICDYAHTQGVLVHGLGTSKADVLKVASFDTVDSTTWLSAVRFGQFAGWMYPRTTGVSYRQQGRIQVFEEMVRKMGHDPARLLLPGGAGLVEKYEVAIALMQQRQDEAPPIRAPITSVPMFGLDDEK